MTTTKELLTDFSNQPLVGPPITMDGEIVEKVDRYQFPASVFGNRFKMVA